MKIITQTSGALLIAGAAFFLGILADWFFWDGQIGINFTLFVVVIIACCVVLTRKYHKSFAETESFLLIPIVFFGLMTAVRASELLTFFNIIATGILMLFVLRAYLGASITKMIPEEYVRTVFLPFQFIRPFFDACGELLAIRAITDHPRAREIIRGFLLAIVGLLFFSWLFSSADLIFAEGMKKFFSFSLDAAAIGHILRVLIVTAFFLGVFSYAFRCAPSQKLKLERKNGEGSFGSLEASISLGSIAALFFFFIVLQIQYLLGGESHFFAQGITYAEYARKGFFELIVVAVAAFLVISTAERFMVRKENKHVFPFTLLSSVLVAEVAIILASAWMRLSLYESAYGFSTIRLYSHALMLWIVCMLLLLVHHIYARSTQAQFTFRAFISVIIALMIMNIYNPDAFIANKNIARYHETGKVDVTYLAALSDDAVPITISLLSDPDGEVRDQFRNNLQWIRNTRMPVESSWKSFTFSRMNADTLLAPYMSFYPIHQKVLDTSVSTDTIPQAVILPPEN